MRKTSHSAPSADQEKQVVGFVCVLRPIFIPYSTLEIDVTYSFTEASWPYGGCSSETLPPPSVSPPRAPALAEKRQLGSNTFLRGLHQ